MLSRLVIFISIMSIINISFAEPPVHSFSLPVSKTKQDCKASSTPQLGLKAGYYKNNFGVSSCNLRIKESQYQFCYSAGSTFMSDMAGCKIEYAAYMQSYILMSEGIANSTSGTCHFMCLVKSQK